MQYLILREEKNVNKAIRIAGLRECIVRYVPMDEKHKVDIHELEKLISADRNKKLNPFLVIASAGTTDVGAVDPLEKIGKIARKNNLLRLGYGLHFNDVCRLLLAPLDEGALCQYCVHNTHSGRRLVAGYFGNRGGSQISHPHNAAEPVSSSNGLFCPAPQGQNSLICYHFGVKRQGTVNYLSGKHIQVRRSHYGSRPIKS